MSAHDMSAREMWFAVKMTAATVWRCWRTSRRTGIPYQELLDAEVRIVREYNDEMRQQLKDAERREKAHLN